MDDLLQVGVITNTHGIKGEVKVFPTTDDPQRFLKLDQVIIDTGKEHKTIEIEQVKFFKQFVILKFRGIDHIEEVEKYKSNPLLITRQQAVELEEDEYFIADLIGMTVESDQGEVLGIIRNVLQTGANDVYCIGNNQEDEILIPAIKECVLTVDTQENKMKVHLIEGLRD